MINFFGNQDSSESTDSRLDGIEWKVNLLLAIVGIHLLLSVLRFVGSFLVPSTSTIVIVGLLVVGVCWFLRDRISVMIRRLIARQIMGDDHTESSSASQSSKEERIL